MTKYWMLIGSEACNYSLIVLYIINVLPKQTKWRQAKRWKALKPLICIILDHAFKIKFGSHLRHIGTPGPVFFAGVRVSF